MIRLSDIKVGDVLIADAGFMCIDNGTSLVVDNIGSMLFVPCRCGQHFLNETEPGFARVGLSSHPLD